jgi:hypothetical protein
MRSHLVLMLIFSLCVSAVFAGLLREDPREQWSGSITLVLN